MNLTHCRKDGLTYFETRSSILQALILESANPKNSKIFMNKVEKFNAEKTVDLEVSLMTRFCCDDTSALIASIAQLGKGKKVILLNKMGILNIYISIFLPEYDIKFFLCIRPILSWELKKMRSYH